MSRCVSQIFVEWTLKCDTHLNSNCVTFARKKMLLMSKSRSVWLRLKTSHRHKIGYKPGLTCFNLIWHVLTLSDMLFTLSELTAFVWDTYPYCLHVYMCSSNCKLATVPGLRNFIIRKNQLGECLKTVHVHRSLLTIWLTVFIVPEVKHQRYEKYTKVEQLQTQLSVQPVSFLKCG